MTSGGLWTALTRNRARTHPQHPDPSLRGRTYAIPFAQVWRAAVELASGGLRGWSLLRADEDVGVMEAESRTLVFRFVDDVRIVMALDQNGQTRVDVTSASRKGKGDLGANARRIRRFFRALDRRVGAGPGTILEPAPPLRRNAALLLLFFSLLATGCAQPRAQAPQEEGETADSLDPARNFQGRGYERDIVFLTTGNDSTIMVPWSFTARTRPGGVDREIRGWLVRDNTWDAFAREEWEGPPSRVPWRILPRNQVRIIVGMEDALEWISFQEAGRSLEVGLGDLLVEWSGPRAQVFRVHEGTASLSEARLDGFVLDLSRGWTSQESPPGDWAFLVAGDSLQMVMENTLRGEEADGGSYSVWARISFTDRQWQGVRLLWTETRAFEPARRDVPTGWEVQTREGDLAGALTSVSPYLEAEEGEGPVLPVNALYLVEGTLTLEGREFPVRGLVRHHQH